MIGTASHFARLWALGYRRLVPVIPPDAEVSPNSSLHKRVGTNQDARGKLPGVRGPHGWHSWDWTQHEASPDDLPRWAAMGAGTGIKTGQGLIAIDADTVNPEHAKAIRDIIAARLGTALPIRVGRYPKAIYLCRVDGPFPYTRVDFGTERVEILSDGRFFVAEGVHPGTGKPYTWPRPLVPYDELPTFGPVEIMATLEAIASALPAATRPKQEGGGLAVNQASLRGDPAHIRKAVQATPNTTALFPTREAYRDYGYAIKASIPDDPEEAFDIWSEWCERWPGNERGTNDAGVMRADWSRMHPPFKRGAGWLYEIAETHAPAQFNRAEIWFEPITPDDSPFAQQKAAAAQAKDDSTYPLLTLDEIVARPPPVFLIDRHIPDVSVGFLYSDPGAGKSFLAIDIGLTIAHGLPDWHGEAVSAPPEGVVIYLAAEGSFDLRNRVRAWHKARQLAGFTERFLVIERTIDFMHADDIAKLVRTIEALGVPVAFVVVDTVSRAMPGADENLQKDMTLFVAACDRVRDRFRCAVLGVHHAGKSGDMRGSTVLRGAGDYVMRLERKRGATVGTLAMEKQKAAPDGWDYQIAFGVVGLDDGQSSLVPSRLEMTIGPGADLTPDVAARALAAMRAAWDAGEPWSKAPQAKERYSIRRMVADHGFKADAAEDTLRVWESSGLITVALRDAKRRISGYQVAAGALDNLSGGAAGAGVFG